MNCATQCGLVGSVIPFLAKRPAAADDLDNPLRRVLAAPVDENIKGLARRQSVAPGSGRTTGFRVLHGLWHERGADTAGE